MAKSMVGKPKGRPN